MQWRGVESMRSCPRCDRVTFQRREILAPPRGVAGLLLVPVVGRINLVAFPWHCRECSGSGGFGGGRLGGRGGGTGDVFDHLD